MGASKNTDNKKRREKIYLCSLMDYNGGGGEGEKRKEKKEG